METQIKDPSAVVVHPATAHTRNRYNLIAPIYDLMEGSVEARKYREWRRLLWSKVVGPNVLELGVGTGKNIPFYPDTIMVTGVDLSERMLARAHPVKMARPKKRVALYEMDIEHLNSPDETFDESVATFVFCSVPDPVQGLRETYRTTKPGGRLLLLEHMLSSNSVLARIMELLDPVIHWIIGVHIARKTVENVEKAGWTIDRVSPLDSFDIFRMIEAHKP